MLLHKPREGFICCLGEDRALPSCSLWGLHIAQILWEHQNCLGALKWLTCRSVIWSRRAGSSSAWSHWDISSWTETTYCNWFLTLIFHCFQTSQPMPQTHTSSYKGSLTDFLNTFRASKRNLSYNNGFRRLKIIITKIIIRIYPQKSRFFHSTALEDSNSAETIISQAALLSQGTEPAFLTLLPGPKATNKLAEKLQTCCCPCVPWQGGEPWDHQDQCWKHQSGMAWGARNRQRWQHCHPPALSVRAWHSPEPTAPPDWQPALQLNPWFSY